MKTPSSLEYTFYDFLRLGFVDAEKKISQNSVAALKKHLKAEDPIVNSIEIKVACKLRIETEKLELSMISLATGIGKWKLQAYFNGKGTLARLDLLRLTTFLAISFKIIVQLNEPPKFK